MAICSEFYYVSFLHSDLFHICFTACCSYMETDFPFGKLSFLSTFRLISHLQCTIFFSSGSIQQSG